LLIDLLVLCDGFKKLIFRKVDMNLEVTHCCFNGSYGIPLDEKEIKTKLLNFLEENGLEKKETEHVQKYGISLTGHTFVYEGLPFSVLVADAGVEMRYVNRNLVTSLLKKFAERIGKNIILKENFRQY